MPGRYNPFEDDCRAIAGSRVDIVVCLAPPEEVREKSPEYARALEAGELGWETRVLGIPDFGVPDDREGYLVAAQATAADLNAGKRIVIHCGAGIGRTGTFAACVLMALGLAQDAALGAVDGAGGHPETPEQRELAAWAAGRLYRG